ncbi:hypothetical protein K432DRAFT_410564 [Lepidopterella palustris CBS 459.81]|uniref:Major facilitator superfamily (MFS) profile domain-containing protein n=1 Tax=Lepidopterella palustris CBS 459.81 TaxID=1314670 RepID=A0A8E2J8T1_9PEZI|nr:hypothetical protein K432DRAFT_410564 [Lepidopterella palustris CBS 459.81]
MGGQGWTITTDVRKIGVTTCTTAVAQAVKTGPLRKVNNKISGFYDSHYGPVLHSAVRLLQMFQRLTGANYFFYYGTAVFQATSIQNSFVAQMILNSINFGVTPIGIYLVKAGRRLSLIIGSVWMFLMFIVFATCGHFSLDY